MKGELMLTTRQRGLRLLSSLALALQGVACTGDDGDAQPQGSADGSVGGVAAGGEPAGGGTGDGTGGGPGGGSGGGRPDNGDPGGAPAPIDASPGVATDAGASPDLGPDADPATGRDASLPDPDLGTPGPDPRLATLIPDAAAAVCGALFRCCDTESVVRYFEPYTLNDALAEFAPRLPPLAELSAEACPAVVADMLTVMPFGGWVEAALAGYVRLVPQAFDACLEALETAACGDDVTAALFDSTCFWIAPPSGGEEQRTLFARTGVEGTPCRSLNDGFGGVFFGTCDPDVAFCCYGEAGACDFPEGASSEGTCRTAGAEGDACNQFPLQLCRTGLDCAEDGVCRAPAQAPLAAGDPCIDERFNLLGECVDAYCDVFDTSRCVPRRADGEACRGADECLSRACLEGACGDPRFCESPQVP
jgi:hypothetical protein